MKEQLRDVSLLIVEDDDISRETYTTILEEYGSRVTAATTYHQACDLLDEHSYDVVISDLALCGASGLDLLQLNSVKQRDIPVIVVTAYGGAKTAAEALRRGAHDYIFKPLGSITELISAVEKAVSHRRLKQQNDLLYTYRQKSEARYRSLFETAHDAVFIYPIDFGPASPFCEVNQAACKLLAEKKPILLQKTILDITHPDYQDRYYACLNELISGENTCYQSRMCALDGTVIPVELRISSFTTPEGRYVLLMAHDIRARRELEQRLSSVSEHERSKLGHELHDELCQDLTGMQLLTESIRTSMLTGKEPSREDIDMLHNLSVTSSIKARSILRGLFPVELEKQGLGSVLNDLAMRTSAQRNLLCRYIGPLNFPPLDKQLALNLFRIAQEALTNAAHHSEATDATIRVVVDQSDLTLSVEDNGKGLPPNFKYTGGIGIDIMHHRAELCASRLMISSSDSQGTCLSCRVKIRECLDMDESKPAAGTRIGSAALNARAHDEKRSTPPISSE